MHPFLLFGVFLSLAFCANASDPLACQQNNEFPMLPIFHIIGNVTKSTDGSIKLEPINDCSGVTYYGGLYHVWHQCCQNHWDHVISKDLIHWQRLPPPIQPVTLKTWDGSISMLPAEDGGPVIIYDAQDGKMSRGNLGDRPILGVARLKDPKDKYLMTWTRDANNPVQFTGAPAAFPGQVWKNGDHWNFVMQGARYTTTDKSFHSWTNAGKMVGLGENGGQWWTPVPNQADGIPPPAGVPNRIVNVGGGDQFLFGSYGADNETFTPWSPEGETPGREAKLERGTSGWFGSQMANDRMLMIGWAMPDFHGDAGKGIDFLTRLTLLREIHFDNKTMNLVSNPVNELANLRTGILASKKGLDLSPKPMAIQGTEGGAAASADITVTFSGFSTAQDTVFGACVLTNSSAVGGMGVTVTVHAPSGTQGRRAAVALGPCGDQRPKSSGSVPLFDETALTVRITPDRSVADFFVQGGRFSGDDSRNSPKLLRPRLWPLNLTRNCCRYPGMAQQDPPACCCGLAGLAVGDLRWGQGRHRRLWDGVRLGQPQLH